MADRRFSLGKGKGLMRHSQRDGGVKSFAKNLRLVLTLKKLKY